MLLGRTVERRVPRFRKAANGGGAKKSTKRKAEKDSEEGVAAECGPIGGVSGLAKKRARVTSEEAVEAESIKHESEKQDGYEGTGTEGEEDVFFEAEDGSGEAGYEGESERDEYEA